MPAEVEAKFLATGSEPLAALAAAPSLGPAALEAPRTVIEVDRYLDTDDRRLARAGWACRLRQRDEGTIVSLKGPAQTEASGGVHRRPEVEGPAGSGFDPAGWPATAARDLVDRLRVGATLVEVVRLVQRRTERTVRVAGRRVGVLSLDAVTIEGAADDDARLHVVELEVDAATGVDEAELAPLVEALAATHGLVADRRTKLDHALARLGAR
jgi:inorganic triphosphatase YgiF